MLANSTLQISTKKEEESEDKTKKPKASSVLKKKIAKQSKHDMMSVDLGQYTMTYDRNPVTQRMN